MTPENTHMRKQSGIALITTLLLLLLMSAMVVGFMLLVTEGQRLSGMDSDQLRAFYGAESGMEKLTADLGSLFGTTYAPAGTQVDALMNTPPNLPSSTGVSYVDSQGVKTYSITYPKDGNGNPLPTFAQITSGSSAFQGMSALETTYTLTVGALTNTGGAVKLTRTTQTVGIPLFQFGIFSETDLSFFPGPNFDFGGRVHTNGNLFLDSGGPAGSTPAQAYPPTVQLWMRSPVTASKDIMRDCLSNTYPESATAKHPGSVEITKGGGTMQALGFGQGSLNNCLGSGANPNWPTISASFNGNLRTGVKPLNLTITLLGNGISSPIDMIRRPAAGELTSNPGVLGERYFSQASLRVLISDNPADITGLPCVSAGAPFNLADLALPVAQWATANATNLKAAMTAAGTLPVPLAASGAAGKTVAAGYTNTDGYWQVGPTGTATPPTYGTPIITGYIKIDRQTAYGSPCGTYVDTTQEILSLGYAGRNINPVSLAPPTLPALPGALVAPSACLDPHPNAIIRLERVRDNPSTFATNGGCGVSAVVVPPNPSDYWPNALFDPREGYNRQPTPGLNTQVTLGGIMNYIELDVKNLAKWFNGTLPAAGSTGPSTKDPVVAPNNFVVYISDRRGNYLPTGTLLGATPVLSPSGHETGEYGYFDLVNRSSANGCPDGVLEPAGASGVSAEDIDGSGVLSTYGENTFPNGLIDSTGVSTASTLFTNDIVSVLTADPLCATGSGGINPWPRTFLKNAIEGRENPNALFRRAVKIMDGNVLAMPNCPGAIPCGLSIATENPAYLQGDFNANSAGGGFADASVAASIGADAITILSNSWNDVNSFAFPFAAGTRVGTTTYVRAGIMAGKQIAFNQPAWDTTAIDGSQDFGTDGGVHNFMRFIEKWNGTLFYEGSIVSMYYSRQATGLFNSGGNNYGAPTRGYSFDVNFLNPTLLPPRTPMFRDVNTTGFTQLMLPNQ
jgi:hypothetical protein